MFLQDLSTPGNKRETIITAITQLDQQELLYISDPISKWQQTRSGSTSPINSQLHFISQIGSILISLDWQEILGSQINANILNPLLELCKNLKDEGNISHLQLFHGILSDIKEKISIPQERREGHWRTLMKTEIEGLLINLNAPEEPRTQNVFRTQQQQVQGQQEQEQEPPPTIHSAPSPEHDLSSVTLVEEEEEEEPVRSTSPAPSSAAFSPVDPPGIEFTPTGPSLRERMGQIEAQRKFVAPAANAFTTAREVNERQQRVNSLVENAADDLRFRPQIRRTQIKAAAIMSGEESGEE